MPLIEVLPHESLCPDGKHIEAESGSNLAQVLLDAGIDLEHACGLVCARTP
jgi:2Fe-2S ferredoxin